MSEDFELAFLNPLTGAVFEYGDQDDLLCFPVGRKDGVLYVVPEGRLLTSEDVEHMSRILTEDYKASKVIMEMRLAGKSEAEIGAYLDANFSLERPAD